MQSRFKKVPIHHGSSVHEYGIHKQDYDFFPKTYILPTDAVILRRDWDESAHKKWILKPVRDIHRLVFNSG